MASQTNVRPAHPHARPIGFHRRGAAAEILRQAGITNVEIFKHEKLRGDPYDPKRKRLVLSSANFHFQPVGDLLPLLPNSGVDRWKSS